MLRAYEENISFLKILYVYKCKLKRNYFKNYLQKKTNIQRFLLGLYLFIIYVSLLENLSYLLINSYVKHLIFLIFSVSKSFI